MHDPRIVARKLRQTAALLRLSRAPKFKIKAYERAAEVVALVDRELAELIEQGRVRELGGVGVSISAQIQEIWNTGSSSYLQRLEAEQPAGASELAEVEGVTHKRLLALSELGIRSVGELQAACLAERVRNLPGFGARTEARLLAAAERVLSAPAVAPPAPLIMARALELGALFEARLAEAVEQVHTAGALRRGEETIQQLDYVLIGDADSALRRLSRLRQVLRIDAEARAAQLVGGWRLELHVAQPDELGTALVTSTGNAAHLEGLHALARSRGFALCGKSARRFASETELYAALGLAFIPPELRRGRDEFQQARAANFDDLIELGDIKGMVHCHTTYSDGKHGILEMAQAAQALGMQYLTITDHSQSAHYARGVLLDALKRQWDEIARVQAQVQIRILRGTESDILAEGGLDYPDAVLEQFDVLIASIHARHRLDRRSMTERLQRALGLPLFKIWGHPLGRLLNHRPPIDCDVEAVLDALAAAGGAVEINADPHRLDFPAEWIPAARSRRLPFVISVDAHSTRGFEALRYGVKLARRGAIRRHEVLNALPAEDFARRVRPCAS
jgi:DNA polymerase (family 10)